MGGRKLCCFLHTQNFLPCIRRCKPVSDVDGPGLSASDLEAGVFIPLFHQCAGSAGEGRDDLLGLDLHTLPERPPTHDSQTPSRHRPSRAPAGLGDVPPRGRPIWAPTRGRCGPGSSRSRRGGEPVPQAWDSRGRSSGPGRHRGARRPPPSPLPPALLRPPRPPGPRGSQGPPRTYLDPRAGCAVGRGHASRCRVAASPRAASVAPHRPPPGEGPPPPSPQSLARGPGASSRLLHFRPVVGVACKYSRRRLPRHGLSACLALPVSTYSGE